MIPPARPAIAMDSASVRATADAPPPLALVADESVLLSGLRAGNVETFAAVVRLHFTGLCGYAYRYVGDPAVVEELVQDVLLRVWERRVEINVRQSLKAYLYAATRNAALNYAKHERAAERTRRHAAERHGAVGVASRAPAADDAVRVADLAAALDRAVSRLPARCRETYLLRWRHGLSYAEIAHVMRTAPKTVEVQIGIALKALRRELVDWVSG
jgi:RNA polymerase sigma-70 factor (ECF subfamily)